MSKRALRRHHRARMVEKAKKIVRRWYSAYEPEHIWYRRMQQPREMWLLPPEPPDFTRYDDRAPKVADNLKICSRRWCGCGNVRRHGGWNGPVLTRQERAAELALREWEWEVDDAG